MTILARHENLAATSLLIILASMCHCFYVIEANEYNERRLLDSSELRNEISKLDLPIMYSPADSMHVNTLHLFAKKLLKKILTQNEQQGESLNECYAQLSKYSRLMILKNKKATATSFETNRLYSLNHLLNKDDASRDMFNLNNNKSFVEFRFKPAILLHKEMNFYLSELEQSYKVINELQVKIQNLNNSLIHQSSSQAQHQSSVNNDIHGRSTSNELKDSSPNDCTFLEGNGFIQVDVLSNMKSFESFDPMVSNILNKMTVYCENRWMVIQQRFNGFDVSFNRTWHEYSNGFGSLRGDFWLGLEFISKLTQQRPYELLIELTDWSDQIFVAKYEQFEVGDAEDFYRLSLSGSYSGNASQDFLEDVYFGLSSQNGAYFSTYDHRRIRNNSHSDSTQPNNQIVGSNPNQVNQIKSQQRNCALRSGGGWWFNNFITCLPVNLNGVYVMGASAPSARGIKWQAVKSHDRNYALKRSKMKIKPKYQ